MEDEEDGRATPERPVYSPLGPENTEGENDKQSEDINKEIKTEPADMAGDKETTEVAITKQETATSGSTNETTDMAGSSLSIQQPSSNECLTEKFNNTNENTLKTAEVRIKDEPFIDYGMPICKTPRHTSQAPDILFSDMESTRVSSTLEHLESGLENVKQLMFETNVNNEEISTAKAALDAYLDGIETPIAPVHKPRLRVKTEFAFLAPPTPQKEPSPEPPPPPPLFSANSNADTIADGIATPRLSIAAINRLRVKSEYSTPSATPQYQNEDYPALPEDYFDDLLVKQETENEPSQCPTGQSEQALGVETVNQQENEQEPGEITPEQSDEASGDEPIPENFFNDLLVQNEEVEEKYANRLREVEREKRKRRKQKKAKKKSRKRSRSRSLSPSVVNRDKNRHLRDDKSPLHHDKMKRRRLSPCPRSEKPCSSTSTEESLRPEAGVAVKTEFSANDFDIQTQAKSNEFIETAEEIQALTPKQKRERAIKRASALLEHLKDNSADTSNILSSFPFVSTVRKLPASHSYVQQQIYENRSPLHTINNVSYKFNSHTTRFNMEEWGLAALPTHAAKMAKLVGCDAQFIHNKLKTIKIPAKLKKVKQEPNNNNGEENEEEELIATSSSLFCNAMTQTDNNEEFDRQLKTKGYEIGIQVEPSLYSIGCQTLETQSPTEDMHKDDEAPIMNIIRDLNENQLMAIHQFAELIKVPNTNATAMELYKIQTKISDIYKISQIPSALAPQQSEVRNNYTSSARNSPQHRGGQNNGQHHYHRNDYNDQTPQLAIASVCGADGKQFPVNDPRANSAAYAKRIVNDGGAGPSSSSSLNYDARYFAPGGGRSSPKEVYTHQSSYNRSYDNERGSHYSNSSNSYNSQQRQYPSSNPVQQPTNTKRFGRGALRR